ncbi:MAG: 3-methyl-2-oxobutanoate hydroxymethyltransferase [Dehalococcoidia bacterium]|nr:3-methyl-2-oxobutanoate hydroxymethyltransferase [Dehalococcoidia bacterium]
MRVTVGQLREMKAKDDRITMLTAYDFSTARLLDESGVDMLLVGDSLGMVVLGYENTLPVTMDEMIHHSKAVARGTKRALVVGDMPFMTYHAGVDEAIKNAGRFIQEAGVQAVKLEGGVKMAEKVRRIVDCGIPVMGHIGLTPQSINQIGQKVQGKSASAALDIVADAEALEQAGAFAIVLECVPARLSRLITGRLSVPTIGIGAGVGCDGQVQVIHDLLGLISDFVPKHAKQYAQLGETIRGAAKLYVDEVRSSAFPTAKESFIIDNAVLAEVEASLAASRRGE